jgi:hypothetical protein
LARRQAEGNLGFVGAAAHSRPIFFKPAFATARINLKLAAQVEVLALASHSAWPQGLPISRQEHAKTPGIAPTVLALDGRLTRMLIEIRAESNYCIYC